LPAPGIGAWLWSAIPTAEVPGSLEGQVVTVGDGVAAIGVRHAQDIDPDRYEGSWAWATATLHVRALIEAEPVNRHVVCDFVVTSREERISIGDADGDVLLPTPGTRTRVIVSTDLVDQTGLENVWIDLVPAAD
jgi:hypothetical protein